MKFCQVSTFLLAIALSHLTYAAPATTNSVLSSSEAKGIIKNQYIVILNKDVGLLTSLHRYCKATWWEGITDL
jgi:predicted lipoprotein